MISSDDKVRNYIRLKRPIMDLFYREYIYLDSEDYFADRIFEQKKIMIKFYPEEFKKGPWVLVRCRIMKKHEEKFIQSMKELSRNICLFTDKGSEYEEQCKNVQQNIATAFEQ